MWVRANFSHVCSTDLGTSDQLKEEQRKQQRKKIDILVDGIE